VSAVVAGWAYLKSRSDQSHKDIQEQIDASIAPIDTRVTHVTELQKNAAEQLMERMEGAIAKALSPVREDIAGINAKIEPLWAILLNIAKDQADQLHHPDPQRAELDGLLEHFKADTLTADEELLLRRYLYKIKDWKGEDIGFKVYPNEPTNAGILLRIMEYGMDLKGQGRIK
jgi:hypothetical protein